jgi:hypothetical protein
LSFNYDEKLEVTELYLGSIDEVFLTSQVGTELVGDADHIWMANGVPGVTDALVGKKFLGNREDGEVSE